MRGQARVRVSERLSVIVRVTGLGVKRDKGFVRVIQGSHGGAQGTSVFTSIFIRSRHISFIAE